LEKTPLLREEDKMTIITRRMMMIVMFDGWWMAVDHEWLIMLIVLEDP